MRQLRGARRHVHRKAPKPRWYRPALFGAALLSACVASAALGWWLINADVAGSAYRQVTNSLDDMARSSGFRVSEVLALGRQRTRSGEIRAKIEKIYGQNILLVDIAEVRKDLEKLPWIRSASVRRLLPDTLELHLVERRPMAVWQAPDGVPKLIDERGEVIDVEDIAEHANLPVISGVGVREVASALFGKLLSEPALASRVSGAELVDERRWNVFLDGRIEIKLPAENVEAAWKLLASTDRETALLQRAVGGVDLRNPDWLVLQLLDEAIGRERGHRA